MSAAEEVLLVIDDGEGPRGAAWAGCWPARWHVLHAAWRDLRCEVPPGPGQLPLVHVAVRPAAQQPPQARVKYVLALALPHT